jgi:NDP-sugar pyrophosphorylase family protein
MTARPASLTRIDVAVLAGGLGTRLRGAIGTTPKVLAPIAGRPFLDLLLERLAAAGATRVVLCLGYGAEAVRAHLQSASHSMEIVAVSEPRPLGTAGALANALPQLRSDPVMVMNGDTLLDADLPEFLTGHLRHACKASMLCVQVADAARYGAVEIGAHGRVTRFREKGAAGAGWINAGAYLFTRALIDEIGALKTGSLETDVLEALPAGSIHAVRTRAAFLDIGTPDDLALASQFAPDCQLAERGPA